MTEIGSKEANNLVERAKQGDADAFSALYKATIDSVFAQLRWRTSGDTPLAEDLTSETYMRAMRSLSNFEGSSKDFLSWLHKIARNLFLDHVKSGHSRYEQTADTSEGQFSQIRAKENPEDKAVAEVSRSELMRALTELTDEQAEVLRLRFLLDMSVSQTAEILGRQEGAVKALQFRALRSLAKIVKVRGLVN